LALARYYLVRGRSEEAAATLRAYDRIAPELELKETAGGYLFCQGFQKLEAGETAAAITDFRQIQKQSGSFPGAEAWIGNAYYADAQFDSAIVYYESYLSNSHPLKIYNYRNNLAKTLAALADSYERTGQPSPAARYYQKLADLWADADPKIRKKAERMRKEAERLLGEGS